MGAMKLFQQQRLLTFVTGVKVQIWMLVYRICQALLEVSDDPLLGLPSPPPSSSQRSFPWRNPFPSTSQKGLSWPICLPVPALG